MTVENMKTGFVEKIGGTIFVVNAMPAENAKHTQEELVKALIAKEAMALQEADVALCMGVEEIAEDFCDSILVKTVTMLDDFGTVEVSDLCEKYGEYIDSRYYMYREEHRFEMPEDVLPGDGVKPYVEEIIRLLKSKV